MTDFAKLYVYRCKDCKFCLPYQHKHVKRHYCTKQLMDGCAPRTASVAATKCACDRFINRWEK